MSGAHEPILRSREPITLVGGAVCRDEDLSAALRIAPRVVAADGGARHVLDAGLEPELIVGDMDSLAPELKVQLGHRIHEVSEQDSTDFEKVLRAVEAPLLVGVGFLGTRLDHELAAISVLARSGHSCVLIGPHDVIFAAPADREVFLDLPVGTRVSLFPMARVTGRSSGLKWPVDGIEFRPSGPTGTSNEAEGRVGLLMNDPGMVVLVPRECLDAAIAAMG